MQPLRWPKIPLVSIERVSRVWLRLHRRIIGHFGRRVLAVDQLHWSNDNCNFFITGQNIRRIDEIFVRRQTGRGAVSWLPVAGDEPNSRFHGRGLLHEIRSRPSLFANFVSFVKIFKLHQNGIHLMRILSFAASIQRIAKDGIIYFLKL